MYWRARLKIMKRRLGIHLQQQTLFNFLIDEILQIYLDYSLKISSGWTHYIKLPFNYLL